MSVYECKFTYGNQSSDEFGVFLCSFDSGDSSTTDEPTNLILSKNNYKKKFDLHGVAIDEPLIFNITIAKVDGTFFDANEEEAVKKWLCKNSWNYLKIEQDDLADKSFCCIINNPQKVKIGKKTGGISFTVTCNSNIAWGEKNKRSYHSTSTLTFNFNYKEKFDKELLSPVFTIHSKANGTISIKNNTTNKILTVNGCTNGETMIFDSESETFESSTGRALISSWNKTFINMIDGNNSITLTGNFSLTIEYRLPVRIGG